MIGKTWMGRLARVALVALALPAQAGGIGDRPGWQVFDTDMSYEDLIGAVTGAVKAHGFGVVTQAGPTQAAARRGIEIPGNRVIGVFNNDYAVKVLARSTAAMIEAPIRFYVTENPDGSATLSYKTPSLVFAPYLDDGGDALADLATELDGHFLAMAQAATR
ncbi:MAG: DUF302 domain-containing protein [Marinibacterium sp.]|nr:DUF302 domain-containing protein [Marinibacterium sp.]